MVDRDGLENRCTVRYRGFGGGIPPSRRGDRSERASAARGPTAPMEICEVNLDSRAKPGIPPAPVDVIIRIVVDY